MKDRYRIPILLVLFIIMVYQLQRRGKEEYQKDSLLLKNNFKMEGIVKFVLLKSMLEILF